MEAVVEAVAEAEAVDEGSGAVADGGAVEAIECAVVFEFFDEGEVFVVSGVFGDESDAGADGVGLCGDGESVDGCGAGGGSEQAAEHTYGGGFAGAVGTEEAEDFSSGDGEGEVLDGGDGGGLVGEDLGEGEGLDGRLGHGAEGT